MTDLLERLSSWMEDHEDEHLEFKEARRQFGLEELIRYCCAWYPGAADKAVE